MKNEKQEIIFVDASVFNLKDALLSALNSNAKIVFLDSNSNALEQISTQLQHQKNLDAIHIISHGTSGELSFTNGALNSENFSNYAPLLEQIGLSLSENGDILLYGCDVAKDADGQNFVSLLAKLTQADIAASDDLTGRSELGGDWDLEIHNGKIEADSLALFNYQGVLAQNLINGLGGSSGFGENNYIHADDPLQSPGINITSIFGAQGVKFGSTYYTTLFINNNGIVTFGEGTTSYTPNGLKDGVKNTGTSSPYLPTLALYWTDLDTRAASTNVSPGGTSTGANLVHWDLDTVNKKITITWNDVAEYSSPQNSTTVLAAQMILTDAGNGNMDIEYRYEYVGELKSHTATAGWNAGVPNGVAGVDYYEIPFNTVVKNVNIGGGKTANVTALSDLDTRIGNSGQEGIFQFFLRNGGVADKTLSYNTTNFIGDLNGNVASTSTITLIGDTFTAAIGTVLTGRVSNLPADLTATITINTSTTATLTFTPTVARAFGDTDDRTNITVTFLNSDFSGGSAASVTGSTTALAVDFPNVSPYFGTNNGLTLGKTDPATEITNAQLNVLDPEQTATQLTYTVTTLPTKGTLLKDGVALILNGTFTQDEINNNRVTFAPATEGADNFKFSISDGAGGVLTNQTFNLTITAANTLHTGTPKISGNPWAGQTLTATIDSLVDIDEPNLATTANWQWQSSADGLTWNNINSATNAIYILTPAENGLLIRAFASWGTGIYAETEVSKFISISPNFATVTDSSAVVEPVALPTTAINPATAVNVFDFTIHDGIADTLTTQVLAVKLNTSGNADFSKATWLISGNGIAGSVAGVYDNVANTLTFSGLTIAVADNTNQTYTISAYYSTNTGLTEGQTYGLLLAPNTGLTLAAIGSSTQLQFAQPSINNGTGSKVDVTATKVLFDTQPAGSVSGATLTTQPVLKVTDAFGNLDVDFIDTVSLTENSSGALSGTTVKVATGGIIPFNNILYTATADHETFQITASATGLTPAISNLITSDVVATKLEFSAQPAPTVIESTTSTAFTTVPTVRAVDAQNVLDVDYLTVISLSVTDPVDSVLDGTVNSFTSTTDTDLNLITVTQTPAAGSATFTGLSLQYTGASSIDNLAFRAISGVLTPVNSQTITANSIPYVSAINRANASPTNANSVDFSVFFSENVSGVDASDFALSTSGISGASITNVSGSGASYTVSINTGTDDGSLRLNLNDDDSILSSTGIRLGGGGLGNGSFSSGQTYLIDKTPPTITIDTIAGDNKINAQEDDNSIVISGTTSGAENGQIVTINFGGMTKTASVTNNLWSTSLTPAEIQSFSEGTINVNAFVLDAVGNTAIPATKNVLYDRTLPNCTITSSDYLVSRGETATIIFTFTEAVTGFTEADLNVESGSISTPITNDGGITWTAIYTPTIDIENVTNAITIDTSGVEDNVGNKGLGLTQSPNYSVDTLSPKILNIVRYIPNEAITNADTLTFQITFSEAVQNVDANDFIVTGTSATISNINPVNTSIYDITLANGDLANLNGTAQLDFSALQNISDYFANPLTNLLPTGANETIYSLDNFAATPLLTLVSDTGMSNVDAITNNGNIAVSNLESGATWEFSTDNEVTWTTGVGSDFSLNGDGNYAVLARQTDVLGNVSANAVLNFVLDTAALLPLLALAADSNINNDKITNNGTVTVSNLETSASWEFSADNGVTWQMGAGNTFTISGEGNKTVQVRQTDVSGNLSATANLDFVLDTTIALPTLALAVDSNIDGDKITNNGTVTVSNLEAGASWGFSADNGVIWQMGAGNTFTVSGDGNKTVQVRQTDVAGNLSATANLDFVLDTTIALPLLALAVDSNIDGDKITNNGTVTVSNLEAGASWEFSADDGVTWQMGAGNTFTVSGDGNKTVQVRQTDVAGNLSATANLNFILDTTIALPTLALAVDSNINNDKITNNGTVTVSNLEAGASWEFSADDGVTWQMGAGNTFTVSGDGNKTVQVRQTDVAGNTSTPISLNFVLDTAVITPTLGLFFDSGINAIDKLTNNGTVLVSNLEAGAKWEWSVDNTNWILGHSDRFTLTGDGNHQLFVRQTDIAGNLSHTATFNFTLDTKITSPALTLAKPPIIGNITKSGIVNISGLENQASWQYSLDAGKTWQMGVGNDLALSGDGEKIIIARQIDLAGNVSINSEPLIFILDTTAFIPAISLLQDTGKSSSDRITNNGTVTVSGIENGANWEFSTDNLTWVGSGDFVTLTGDGEKAIFVRQIDPVGNISPSNLLTFVLDTKALLPDLKLVNDTGKVGDLITRDGTVEISNLENGTTWQFSTDEGKTWFTGSGNRFTLYGDGEKNVLVTQTDLAGNNATTAFNFIIDSTIAPLSLTLAKDTSKNGDFITSNGKVNVAGIEPSAKWEYSLDGGQTWKTGQGDSIILTGDGEKHILARQTDLADNTTPVYATLDFVLDSRADMPFLTLEKDTGKNGDLLTSNGKVNVFGLEDGATWRYSTDSGATWTQGVGNQFELFGDGNKTVIVKQTDIAGNENPNSMVLNFTLDTTVAKPAAVLTSDTGKSQKDFITREGTFDVLNLEKGATWFYSLDDGKNWQKGTDSYLTLKNDGNKTVLIKQTDLAGNESETSEPLNFLLDTKISKPILKLDTKDPILHAAFVSDIENGATWEFSADGLTWTQGTGNRLVATNEIKSVLVRQTDIAGNISDNARIGFLPDVPTLTLLNDSGRKNYDFITNDGRVGVSDLESGYFDWQYSLDNEKTWTKGSGDEFTLTGDGVKNIIATQIDSNGNRSVHDGRLNFLLDTVALKPTLSLSYDSGNPTDLITNNGTIRVDNLEPQAIWQYSFDNGNTWKTGVEQRLSISGDGTKNILVKQTDVAGNVSDNTPLTFTLDTKIDLPKIALQIDSGKFSTDQITNQGTVVVSNIEDGATWQFSTDSGATWQNNGEAEYFVLTGDGNKTVVVRQTDLAGNTHLNNAALNFTLDTKIDEPTLQLFHDTGKASNDGITHDGTVRVLGLENGATWEFSENGKDWQIGKGETLVFSGDGNKTVFARQTDLAGNQQTSQSLPFVLDTVPPILNAVQRPNFELPKNFDSFTVQIDYRDLGSGLDLQSISPEDISISGVEHLSVASVKLEKNLASYTINAPKDGWQATHVGSYQISINPQEVFDLAGNSLEPVQNAKTFTIFPKKILKHPDTIKNLLETDSILSTTGKIVDLPNITAQKSVKGQYGTFSIDKFGNWNYETDSPHNEFLQNKIYVDSFPIKTTDDVQSNVLVKIWGTNDIPILVDDFSRQNLQQIQVENVKKNVLNGQVTVQSAQGLPFTQKNNKSWFDLDETQLTFALKDSKPLGVDSFGHSLVKTTLKNGSTLTLNTWDASYKYEPSVATDSTDMIDQFEISADGAILILNLNRLDLSDLDGISPDIEAQLANLATSEINAPITGDLNGDGIADKSQGGVVNIAWRTYDDFKAAQENKLTSAKPIINIVVAKEKASEIDDSAQLSNILVLPENSPFIGSQKPVQSETLHANWDALMFSISAKTKAGLIDMQPNRAGLQTKVIIDISRAGENFNAYLKYVSAKTIEFYNAVGNSLITLDGEKLTSAEQAGWYDFTQRKPDGDGAHFIYAPDGTVKQIEIILTDNAFGDDDPAGGYFTDPGMPVWRGEIPPLPPVIIPEPEKPQPKPEEPEVKPEPKPPVEEKTLNSSVSVNALATEFNHLILQEVQLEKSVTKTEWIDNPLLCLPEWTQLLLDIPAKIAQEVTVIEKFTAPLNGTGNALNNKITGNHGDNILMGLAGKDILTGRAGADKFAYQNVSDSLPESFDVITDFSAVENDKIDLSALDANSNQTGKQSFQYIGMSAFSKQAAQLRFDGTTQQLQGDINGDGKADFVIELSGVFNLASDALILKSQ